MLSYSRPAMEKVSGASKYLFAVVALYIYIYLETTTTMVAATHFLRPSKSICI